MKKLRKVLGYLLLVSIVTSWHIPPISVAEDLTPASRMRREIKSILVDRRFEYPDYQAWWRNVWSRISYWIDRLNSRRPSKQLPFDVLIQKAVNYLGVILLILLPFSLIYFIPRLLSREIRLKQMVRPERIQQPDSVQLLHQAAAFAEQGLILEAIRHLYLAVLNHLQKRELIRQGVYLSDQENITRVRKVLGSDHRVYLAFAKLVRLFQEKWYGLKDCRVTDYETALSLTEIIMDGDGGSHAP